MVLLADGKATLINWGVPSPVAVPFLLLDPVGMALPAGCQ